MDRSGTGVVPPLFGAQVDTGWEVWLESGVTLRVREDGSALGSDGKNYYPVLREYREVFRGYPDVVARVVGWSSDLREEKVLPPED